MTSHFCNFFPPFQTLIFKLIQIDKSKSQILSFLEICIAILYLILRSYLIFNDFLNKPQMMIPIIFLNAYNQIVS